MLTVELQLFETTKGPSEVGAAINIAYNADSVLKKLGVNVAESGGVRMEQVRPCCYSAHVIPANPLAVASAESLRGNFEGRRLSGAIAPVAKRKLTSTLNFLLFQVRVLTWARTIDSLCEPPYTATYGRGQLNKLATGRQPTYRSLARL